MGFSQPFPLSSPQFLETNLDVRIKLFEIERCGYYRRRAGTPAFCTKDDFLDDLYNWVDGKSIIETATYTPTEEQDDNTLRTFCYNIEVNDAGDFLITTWNETPSLDDAVASIDVSGLIGAALVETAALPQGYVPGFPTYFWFPHDVDWMATVQIGNRLNGRKSFDTYSHAFLDLYSRFGVCEDSEDGEESIVVGYSESGNEEDIDHERKVYPRFKTKQLRRASDLDFIRGCVNQINRVVHIDRLTFQIEEDVSLWQSIRRKVFGEEEGQLQDEHKMRVELETSLTLAELNRIIDKWGEEQAAVVGRQFNDVGFKLAGDSKVYWLNSAIASEVFDLDIPFANPPVADAQLLLRTLSESREEIKAMEVGE